MAEKEFFIDDRVIVPDWIKKMSTEEKQKMIDELEAKAFKEKERILRSKKKA